LRFPTFCATPGTTGWPCWCRHISCCEGGEGGLCDAGGAGVAAMGRGPVAALRRGPVAAESIGRAPDLGVAATVVVGGRVGGSKGRWGPQGGGRRGGARRGSRGPRRQRETKRGRSAPTAGHACLRHSRQKNGGIGGKVLSPLFEGSGDEFWGAEKNFFSLGMIMGYCWSTSNPWNNKIFSLGVEKGDCWRCSLNRLFVMVFPSWGLLLSMKTPL
jgi:hypothetical protein